MMNTKNADVATAKAAQPFTIEHLPTGQPALYCKRGLVAIFEAGYQQTREQDAAEVARILNAHGELLEAARIGLACCIAWGGKCEANGEHILARDSVFQSEIIRAAIAKAKGEA